MSPTLEPIHRLAQGVRVHGPALLSGMPEPHDELMSLVWGPRFDREHAMGLVARQPSVKSQPYWAPKFIVQWGELGSSWPSKFWETPAPPLMG